MLSTRISLELEKELKNYAKAKGLSVSAVMERAVRFFLSFTSLFQEHDPDREGIHHYLFLAPEKERSHTGKPITLSFIQNRKIPEDISPGELEMLREDFEEEPEEKLSPGKIVSSLWKDLYERPEDALALIAHIFSQEIGFDMEKFKESLRKLDEPLAFIEDITNKKEG